MIERRITLSFENFVGIFCFISPLLCPWLVRIFIRIRQLKSDGEKENAWKWSHVQRSQCMDQSSIKIPQRPLPIFGKPAKHSLGRNNGAKDKTDAEKNEENMKKKIANEIWWSECVIWRLQQCWCRWKKYPCKSGRCHKEIWKFSIAHKNITNSPKNSTCTHNNTLVFDDDGGRLSPSLNPVLSLARSLPYPSAALHPADAFVAWVRGKNTHR